MEKKPLVKRYGIKINSLILSRLKSIRNSVWNKQGSKPSWDQTIQHLLDTSKNTKKDHSKVKSLEKEIRKLNWEILQALKLSLNRPTQIVAQAQAYSPSFTKIEQNAIQSDLKSKTAKIKLQSELAIEFNKYRIEGQEFIKPSEIVKKRKLIPPEPPKKLEKLNPPKKIEKNHELIISENEANS